MTRRDARQLAFELIFENSFREDPPEEIIEAAVAARGIEPDDFAKDLFIKTIYNLSTIDDLISQNSQKWKIGRISRTALSILRMSFSEILYFDSIPIGATINEAVELAKKYGAEEDFSFVNGVLGGYARRKTDEAPDSVLSSEGSDE